MSFWKGIGPPTLKNTTKMGDCYKGFSCRRHKHPLCIRDLELAFVTDHQKWYKISTAPHYKNNVERKPCSATLLVFIVCTVQV